jgi:AcrR family transcriptional regulator
LVKYIDNDLEGWVGSSMPIKKRETTKQHIFDAARKTFAEKGFSGARMDEIARMARVNKATIYYHIGDKRTLYGQVVKEIFSGVADHLAMNDDAASSPEIRLRRFVRTLTKLINHNTDMAAIMLREQASGAKHFPEIVARDFARIIDLITEILNDGEKAGMFKKTTPVIVHLMAIGTIVFTKMSSPIRSKLAAQVNAFENIGHRPENEISAEIEALILDAVRR